MGLGAMTIPVRVQQITNTTAGWAADVASANPTILEMGENGTEDTGGVPKEKKGDGVHNWAGLAYITGGSAPPETLQDVLNLGNTATSAGGNTGDFILSDSVGDTTHITPGSITLHSNYPADITGEGYAVQCRDNTTGLNIWQLTQIGGYLAQLLLNDGFNHAGTFSPMPLNAAKSWLGPNRNGTFETSGDQVNPTIVLGAGAGTGATATFSATSDDRSGTITFTSGTTPTAGAPIATITFSQGFFTKTRVLLQVITSAGIPKSYMYATGESKTQFVINAATTISIDASITFIITYIVQY